MSHDFAAETAATQVAGLLNQPVSHYLPSLSVKNLILSAGPQVWMLPPIVCEITGWGKNGFHVNTAQLFDV